MSTDNIPRKTFGWRPSEGEDALLWFQQQNQNMEQRHENTMNTGFTAVNKMPTANAYLYTPPEHMADSFSSQDVDYTQPVQQWVNKLPPIQANTPPASPEFKDLPSIEQATGFASHDLPLYPEDHSQRPTSQAPLFHRESSARQATPPPRLATRTPERSLRPDIFPSILGVTSPKEALDYWNSRKTELKDFKAALQQILPTPSSRSNSFSRREAIDEQQLRKLEKVSRSAAVTKPRSPPKQAVKPKAPAAASPIEKPLPQRRRTPKARPAHDFNDGTFGTAQQPAKHKRAPPSKKVELDNVTWNELPDYAPPTSTLDNNLKPLKATWHGSPIDLSSDQDREHLHPQELVIAAALRLTCAQYLANKRKIFQARLQSIKDSKNFTKTAAQGACSIDVNKASQLWEAFDKAGWFKESWYQQWL